MKNMRKNIFHMLSNGYRSLLSGNGKTVALIFIAVILNFGLTLNAQTDRKYIRQGNGKYSDGEFSEAEILYRKALNDNRMSADAGFNVGDALYRQNKYDEAAKQFQGTTAAMSDNSKKADSYYNLGNSLLKANKFEEAIAAYKNSLRLVPGRNDAKYNLAYAQDQLLMQQEQQNKDQNQDNKNNQNKDQDKNKNQDQKKDQQDKNQEQQKDNEQDQQQQKQQQEGNISKEDAQRLLDALANDEKNIQEKVKEEKAAKARVRSVINW